MLLFNVSLIRTLSARTNMCTLVDKYAKQMRTPNDFYKLSTTDAENGLEEQNIHSEPKYVH